jgi:hypothetical protein
LAEHFFNLQSPVFKLSAPARLFIQPTDLELRNVLNTQDSVQITFHQYTIHC